MSYTDDEAVQRQSHEHIARELEISVVNLAEYPYQLAANTSDDGFLYGWRVLWDEKAPVGITVNGGAGALWSDIGAPHDDDQEGDG